MAIPSQSRSATQYISSVFITTRDEDTVAKNFPWNFALIELIETMLLLMYPNYVDVVT